ncbi:O-antigen ligase family protein [Cupriavidus metallidurans]|jgi:O-antigen ligase|uniref:O-antigen ligase family protein n=1 Tax=Cupriavidus metallidurans TaxID=119219 RepID=UPI000CE02E6D|nr:O-antigen ligase family protein [Cupriavidus metallidurans]AVA36747.1 cell shape-determining protein [Cupriavidus metallidurans]
MTDSSKLLSRMATVLVFAFPVLILCVPRGAGVFLAGVGVLALLGWRGMGRAWREYSKVMTPLAIAVLAFMLVYVGSKLYFHTPWNVIDNPSRTLLAILTCWVIVRAAPNPAWLWRGITVGLFLALLIVGYQKFALNIDRPSAWIQAIAFANMIAALALVGFARPGDSRGTHMEAWVNLLLGTMILMLNGTRGAVVAMLVTSVPMLMIRYRRFSVRMLIVAVCAVATLAIGAYMVPDSPVSKRVDDAVSEIQMYRQGNIETSVGVRLKIWHIGLQYFSEHPWTGVGVGQFARILHASEFCHETKSLACVLEHAHNDIVEAASTTGIPGLMVMLGLFLVPAVLFARALRAARSLGNPQGVSLGGAGLGVVMASLISGLTQVTMAHQANVVFYAGLIGLLLGMAGREAHSARTDAV